MTLHPASTLRPTKDVRRSVWLRVIVEKQGATAGSCRDTLQDRSSRFVWNSAASANRKQMGLSCWSRDHPSMRASSGHRFVRYCGGAWPVRRGSTMPWAQDKHGCSPPTFSRLGPSRGPSQRPSRPISGTVRRSSLASLEGSPGRIPFRPSTSEGPQQQFCGQASTWPDSASCRSPSGADSARAEGRRDS